MPLLCVALIATATIAPRGTVQAQQPAAKQRQRIDVSKLGPKVGQRVPDFTLTDQFGTSRTLASVLGPKGTMLVFFRSADW